MAIISIPTSIGGITIPGLNKGPLGSLFNNPYSSSSLQYPSDLNSATKSHVVRFDIKEVISATVDLQKIVNAPDTVEGKAALIQEAKDWATTAFKNLTDTNKTFSENLSPDVGRTLASIQLYMPDSIEFQSQISYGQKDLLEVAVSLPGVLGKIGGAVGAALQNSATQLALKKFGYALNPQLQLLFESIDFRDFSMSFVFSPNSKEEAQNIQKIIKLFRGYAAPEIVRDTKGMFYRPPAYFDVSFYSNGVENTKINKIKRSVITSVDVNYAPNGWAAHSDGAPVQTTMTLQLKETVLIDRNEIFNNGY